MPEVTIAWIWCGYSYRTYAAAAERFVDWKRNSYDLFVSSMWWMLILHRMWEVVTSECPANLTGKKTFSRKSWWMSEIALKRWGKSYRDAGGAGLEDGHITLGITLPRGIECLYDAMLRGSCPIISIPLSIILNASLRSNGRVVLQLNECMSKNMEQFLSFGIQPFDRFNWAEKVKEEEISTSDCRLALSVVG